MFFKVSGNARMHHFKGQLLAFHTAVQAHNMKSITALNRFPVNDPRRHAAQRALKFRHSLAGSDLSKIAADLARRASGMLPGQRSESGGIGMQFCNNLLSLMARGCPRILVTRCGDDQDVRRLDFSGVL